jgi:hypothetical protein
MLNREPEYVDQVRRREAYETAHPDVTIRHRPPGWEAVIPAPDGNGETIIIRHDLRVLLDKLEAEKP